MKNLFRIAPLVVVTTVGGSAYAAAPARNDSAAVVSSRAADSQAFEARLDFDYCYNYLSPYGTWVRLDPYGYVWRPRHMGYRWRPYSEGHWVWTDDGWMWIDDAEWGWIPFHYGRRGWDDDFGWYWVPGTEWGPAWVTWRWNDMYMGWAPIPPGVDFRAGMDYASVAVGVPARFWVFVGGSHFLDGDVRAAVLPYERNVTIVNYTVAPSRVSFRGNTYMNEGAGIDVVRRVTQRDVPRYTVEDRQQAGPTRVVGNTVQVYRPAIAASAGARPKTALDVAQARRDLAPAKVYEPRAQQPAASAQSTVQRRQAHETALLHQTQSQEMRAIQQRGADEARRAQGAAEKARVQQDYRARAAELQKQQAAERQQLAQRQKRDAEQVRQGKPIKQEPPPKKKDSKGK